MSAAPPAMAELSLWLLTDAAGTVRACAPGSAPLLGVDPRGRALAELFGEPVAQRLLSGLEDALEWSRPAADAGAGPVSWRAERHRLEGGGLLVRAGALKRSQEEVPTAWERRIEQLLHEANQRLELAVSAGQLGLWDWNLVTDTLYFSPTWKAQLGYEEHELPDIPETWTGRIHPEDLGRVQATVSRYLGDAASGDRYLNEFRMRARDGSWRWIAGYALVVRDAQGQSVRATGYHVDITERKEREAAQELLRENLRRTNEHLERLSQLKDEFIANMSHELRTPLNAVLGQAEAMAEGIFGPITDEQRSSLRTIEESGRHLLSLINDVLDISKSTVGRLELELAEVPVEEVCQESLRMVRAQAFRKGISVGYASDGAAPSVWADRRRLRQVLINLLSNAKKFTPDGGRIGLEVTGRPGGAVAFTVWDTGPGIAEEDRQRIFEPFVQLDTGLARRHDGSGLGLSLVRRLVELHRGRLELESEVGRGSRFTVVLPVGR